MSDDGATPGLYIPPDSDLLERFDERYGAQQRSKHIREAMELLLTVDTMLEDMDYEFETAHERKAAVRQGLIYYRNADEGRD